MPSWVPDFVRSCFGPRKTRIEAYHDPLSASFRAKEARNGPTRLVKSLARLNASNADIRAKREAIDAEIRWIDNRIYELLNGNGVSDTFDLIV